VSAIALTHDGAVSTIRFQRPERANAFDRGMLEALADALHGARERAQTRVVVLRGDERAFSTGADLAEYVGLGPLDVRRVNLETWMRVFALIEGMDEPVIAAVRGYAIAGGTELVLACDLVVAAEDAVFGLSEARVGVLPGAGAAVRLPRWVGRAAAKELLMTGDPIDAREAHRLGLVNRLVPVDRLDEATAELAATLAARSPLALAAAKRAVNVGAEMPLQHGVAYVLQEFALLFAGADQREGMSAFLEKRPPSFPGEVP
jgi:enoyl-CoA hydratase/carnithine racemase